MVFKLEQNKLENTALFESGSRTTGSGYGCIYIDSNLNLSLWVGQLNFNQDMKRYVNQEVHLALSVDESIIKLYINGKLANQVSILSETDWGKNNIKLSGIVSQTRLYNRALDENEILNNYAVINPEWKQEHNVRVNLNDAHILNNHKDAVFIFMSPNDISKLEQDLIKLKQEN